MDESQLSRRVSDFLHLGTRLLGLDEDESIRNELPAAIEFWTLSDAKRADIDLAYSGPHYPILPFGEGVCVDFTWVDRRLYDLFVGVDVDNQSFKGRILEQIVGAKTSILPTGECRGLDGQSRQIDCAFGVAEHLVIVECKAVNRSIAFDRGDLCAIEFRKTKVVERALNEVDEKAGWLARHPKGSNYDITAFKDIVPVAVSPFVEFIHSRAWRYWLTDDVARVLKPEELRALVSDAKSLDKAFNRVRLGAGPPCGTP